MKKIILSIYFDGTNGIIRQKNSVTSLLYYHTVENEHSIKMAFDGCGIKGSHTTRLDFQGIFTYGLVNQVESVIKKSKEILADKEVALVINVYGFSRGGAASFLLAKKLNELSAQMRERLEMNIAALEPVPGNLIPQVKADIFQHTLTSSIWDVSSCNQVKRMLILYTNQLIPSDDTLLGNISADAHAPILPSYPLDCAAEIDAINGCHANVQYLQKYNKDIDFSSYSSIIVFLRMQAFLKKCGTTFDFDGCTFSCGLYNLNYSDLTSDQFMLDLYKNELEIIKHQSHSILRPMHKGNEIYTQKKPELKYVNMHHKRLSQDSMELDLDTHDVALFIKNSQPAINRHCQIL